MHISRRLLHTTLYIQPPKLILTGRSVVKKILVLCIKPESTIYTLDRLTWGDTVKVSFILPDGQTTTLVCHRSRPQPPTTNSQCKCSTYSSQQWCSQAGAHWGTCHSNWRLCPTSAGAPENYRWQMYRYQSRIGH